MNRARVYAVVVVLMIALTTSAVMAVPTIDGVVDGDGAFDGYSVHAVLEPADAQGVSNADVFLHQVPNSQFLYMAFVLPLDFVDNTYGTAAHFTWPTHKFENLRGSDELEITADNDGFSKTAKVDYLEGTADGKHGNKNPPFEALIKGSDPEILSDVASSLEYNLNRPDPGDVNYPWTVDSPGNPAAYPDAASWTSEVVYEVKIDLGQLYDPDAGGDYPNVLKSDGTGFDSDFTLTLTNLHASPNKGDDNSFGPNLPTDFTPIAQAAPVPVPGAVVLGAMGLGMVGWTRKRFLNTNK